MGTSSEPAPLFGAVRRGVLALLLGQPEARFHLREIVRSAGSGTGAVQRELALLTAAGILRRQPEGRQVYFSANPDSPILAELQSIVRKTSGIPEALRAALAPLARKGTIEAAAIYGSVAVGAQEAGSDVDLLVVGEVRLAELVPVLRRVESAIGREVNPSIYPAREFRRRLKERTPFLVRVLKGPLIHLGGSADELERLAGQPVAGAARALG